MSDDLLNPGSDGFANEWFVASFRTFGTAATQNLFGIENPNGSGRRLCIRSLVAFVEDTALQTTRAGALEVIRGSGLAAGTTLTLVPRDPDQPSAGGINARGATASDGGVATALTIGGVPTMIFRAPAQRSQSIAGWVGTSAIDLLPHNRFVLVKEGNSVGVRAVDGGLPATAIVVISAQFREEPI